MRFTQNIYSAISVFIVLTLPLLLAGCGGGAGGGSVGDRTSEPTYSISGKVTNAGGSGVANVVISLAGTSSEQQTTAGDGTYSFSSLSKGNYSLTPALSGFVCSPEKIPAVTIYNSNIVGQNFSVTAAAATYSFSGKISPAVSDVVVGGIAVTLYKANFSVYRIDQLYGATVVTGAFEKVTATDGDGSYTFSGVPGGSYTIIPSSGTYLFNPSQSNFFTITDGTTLYLYDPGTGGNIPLMGGTVIYNSSAPIATGLNFSASSKGGLGGLL